MTAYAACGAGGKLTVVPSSTYQVRIAKVEATGFVANTGTIGYQLYVYPSNTPTGGTTNTPLAMRSGAPATTATVKNAPTISGTNYLVHTESVSSPVSGDGVYLNANYQFPFDLILSAGSTFVADFGGTGVVYYEELRLAWSG